jgi:hypothetical protein
VTDMKAIVDAMTAEQSAAFASSFLRTWVDHGFGTLSKRDTELLLFTCLHEALGDEPARSNYDWARLLRITPARVRNLRRDAYIRFGKLLDASEGEALLRRCLSNVLTMQVDLSSAGRGAVQLVADDPLIELELEPRLKALGGYYDYARNREILEIPLVAFLSLVDSLLGVGKDETFSALLVKVLEDQSARAKFDAEVANMKWAGKTEAAKLVDFLEMLARTFAEKPMKLAEYLQPIMGSEKYMSRKR